MSDDPESSPTREEFLSLTRRPSTDTVAHSSPKEDNEQRSMSNPLSPHDEDLVIVTNDEAQRRLSRDDGEDHSPTGPRILSFSQFSAVPTSQRSGGDGSNPGGESGRGTIPVPPTRVLPLRSSQDPAAAYASSEQFQPLKRRTSVHQLLGGSEGPRRRQSSHASSAPNQPRASMVEFLGTSSTFYLGGHSMDIFPAPLQIPEDTRNSCVSSPFNESDVSSSSRRESLSMSDSGTASPLRPAVNQHGLHAPHRNFSDALLSDIHDFLSRVGDEISALALLKATEDGESFMMPEDVAFRNNTITPPFDSSTPTTPSSRRHGRRLLENDQSMESLSYMLSSVSASRSRSLQQHHRLSLGSAASTEVVNPGFDYLTMGRSLSLSLAKAQAENGGAESAFIANELMGIRHPSGDLTSDEDSPTHRLAARQRFPLFELNNSFDYNPSWFSTMTALGKETGCRRASSTVLPFNGGREIVTAEPLLFHAGMLVDPVSGRFLFGGAAFQEEARVLRAVPPPNRSNRNPLILEPHSLFKHRDSSVRQQQQPFTEGEALSVTASKPGRVLLREYISVSRVGGGCVIQTFALLPGHVKATANKHQLISADTARKLLAESLPGAVTRLVTVSASTTSQRGTSAASTITPSIKKTTRSGSSTSSLETVAHHNNRGSQASVKAVVPSTRAGPKKRNTRSSVGKPTFATSTTAGAAAVTRGGRQRAPIGNETVLCETNPALYQWAMERDPEDLLEPTDNIRAFLEYFQTTFRTTKVVQSLLTSVRRIQGFLRRCLARKQRSLDRMLRMWRTLEIEARIKLQHYHPPPSSLERVDLIAGNVLQQHMLTTPQYKRDLIDELWEKRRADYRTWKNQKRLDDLVMTATRRGGGGANGDPLIIRTEKDLMQMVESVVSSPRAGQRRGLPRTASLALTMFELDTARRRRTQLYESSTVCSSSSGLPGSPPKGDAAQPPQLQQQQLSKARSQQRQASGRQTRPQESQVARTVEWARQGRLDEEFHRKFGWYIPPEDLLYVSHQRLLDSLKSSILTVEMVQHEVERTAEENARLMAQASSSVEPQTPAMPPATAGDMRQKNRPAAKTSRVVRGGGGGGGVDSRRQPHHLPSANSARTMDHSLNDAMSLSNNIIPFANLPHISTASRAASEL